MVLKDINLVIGPGEGVSILGANGCGKSTLLKMLSGLYYTSGGSLRAFGEPLTEAAFRDENTVKDYHRRVGFIFQEPDVQLFCSTVREELAFGLLQLNFPSETIEKRIGEVSGMLRIEGLLDKTPFRLSGGEKKKVAIASVLILNPEVMILDEPTNGLDPRTRQWLTLLLEKLIGAGKTVVFSTHDLELAAAVSGRSILFSEAHEVVYDGATRPLLSNAELLKSVNLVSENYRGVE